MPQNCDMGQTVLLPLRRKACWGFFHPKNPTASAGFEPANSGTRGQYDIIFRVMYLLYVYISLSFRMSDRPSLPHSLPPSTHPYIYPFCFPCICLSVCFSVCPVDNRSYLHVFKRKYGQDLPFSGVWIVVRLRGWVIGKSVDLCIKRTTQKQHKRRRLIPRIKFGPMIAVFGLQETLILRTVCPLW
jgi:hypothetical protein